MGSSGEDQDGSKYRDTGSRPAVRGKHIRGLRSSLNPNTGTEMPPVVRRCGGHRTGEGRTTQVVAKNYVVTGWYQYLVQEKQQSTGYPEATTRYQVRVAI